MLSCIAHGDQVSSIPAVLGKILLDLPSNASLVPNRQVREGLQRVELPDSDERMGFPHGAFYRRNLSQGYPQCCPQWEGSLPSSVLPELLMEASEPFLAPILAGSAH